MPVNEMITIAAKETIKSNKTAVVQRNLHLSVRVRATAD